MIGTQVQTYNPRIHQGVVEIENATSRQRAHCGQDNGPLGGGGGGGLSTIWLELGEEPAAALMADWSWDSAANASSSQQTSPMQLNSPLQSSSSQSSHEAMQGPAIRVNSGRTSLVETLQTCLTSLPSASALASPTDPSGTASSPMRQSRSGGALSGPSTSRALGPAKPAKRRSRASRRVPTTVLEATSGDFRDMVQRLTGIPPASSTTPLRPQPQRASPSTNFIRPSQRPPTAPSSFLLNFSPPPAHPASTIAVSDDPPRPIHRNTSDPQFPSLRGSNFMRELAAPIPGSIMITTSRTPPVSTSWWDSAASEQSRQIALQNVSNSSVATNEIMGASRPPGVLSSSSGFVMAEFQEPSDLPEPYMSQFDSPFDPNWLSGDDQ